MKKHLIYIIGIAATLFAACDEISDSDRFLEVEELIPQRVVLLEDIQDRHVSIAQMHMEWPQNCMNFIPKI